MPLRLSKAVLSRYNLTTESALGYKLPPQEGINNASLGGIARRLNPVRRVTLLKEGDEQCLPA